MGRLHSTNRYTLIEQSVNHKNTQIEQSLHCCFVAEFRPHLKFSNRNTNQSGLSYNNRNRNQERNGMTKSSEEETKAEPNPNANLRFAC